MVSAIRWLALGGCAVALAGTTPAMAGVTVPGCAALQAWSATVDLADKSFAVTPALNLPGALADDKLAAVYGARLLDWQKADASAVAKALSVCSREAKKARDQAAVAAYGAGYNAVAKSIPYALATVERSRGNVDKLKTTLDALPDTPELDRGLKAVLDGDPAAPNPADYQGLPRDVVDTTFRLAKEAGLLPAADREPLFAALAARRQQIQASIGGDAQKQIAAAGADIPGIFALMELARKVAGVDADVDARIAARAAEIRTALRAASPARWVPPACTGLYAWAGQQDGNDRIQVGRYQMLAVFADDKVTPVFNVPVADWSDDDMAALATLRGLCMQAWQALPDAQSVRETGPDTSELVRLASKGRWIDGNDSQVKQARTLAANFRAAEARLTQALAEIEALPDTTESLQPLQAIGQRGNTLQALDDGALRRFQLAIQTKRNQIFGKQLDDGLAMLKQVEVSQLDDLPKLVNAGQAAGGRIMDNAARQRFHQTYEAAVASAVLKLGPAFKAELDNLPATRDGLRQAGSAVATLTKVTGTERAPAFGVLHAAAQTRALDIVKALAKANCEAALDAADIDDDDAAQPVWGEGKPTTLGDLVCNMTAGGNPVSGYDGGGMFSGTHELKVTLQEGGLHTIALKKAEVAAGQKMLVGFELADANQKRALAVQDWVGLVGMTTAERFVTRTMCRPVLEAPEDGLSIADRFLAAQCALADVAGRLY